MAIINFAFFDALEVFWKPGIYLVFSVIALPNIENELKIDVDLEETLEVIKDLGYTDTRHAPGGGASRVLKKYVRYLQHGNRNAGRLQTRPRRRERARAHPPYAGTRGSDDPTEIRPEVQGEAPRQAPRVPSRILQEKEEAPLELKNGQSIKNLTF